MNAQNTDVSGIKGQNSLGVVHGLEQVFHAYFSPAQTKSTLSKHTYIIYT